MKPARSLDCTGLFCPMPILRTKEELSRMSPGEILEIVADDPGFAKDLPAWCAKTGEKFLEMKEDGLTLKGYVEKS